MNYTELNLNEKIQAGLSEAGYVTCTPVQEKVLEKSLDGSDLYVQSQTGTGKTAAFLVTIMQEIMSGLENAGEGESSSKKNALILVPTRELAVQVEEEAKKLGKHTGLRFASFYGGVGYEKQVADLKKGCDIIIGTPGRIIDLTEGKQMDLSNVGYLAIDEADRMFDMGFYPDLRKLIHFLPKNEGDKKMRQTMLFSATLNSYVKNLAWEYTREAKEITIEAENITVDEIDQELIHVSSDDKMKLLLGIFKKENPESVIIFCDTKKMCEIVSKRLEINGIKNEYIIGDLPQSKRLKIMDSFKAGKVTCLVATDVAARGIDVNDLAMVVNYDLPNEAENYVHRIGRTARAGKSGKAYTFCSERDVYSLAPIERYIEKQIPSRVAVAEDFEEDKSKNVYIRLDSEEREDRRREKGERKGRSERGERRSRKSDKKTHSKEDFKSFKGDKSKNTVRRASDEEIAKLSGMSSDERLRYFKEKYAKSSSAVYKNDKSAKAKSGKGRGNNRKNPAAARKTETAPKKLGLIARLKSLIGRGK
ncbi:ATP-dependent helicase [Treponema ruminis]|uniref:ATP-dependent RNA helicase RhlB n=1 Tax=Treponema ruminis TaxID=744515 RepID=A0A7W8G779_9SPIR|nr:DEAD/DEAH box helicase [Treponema ruminis]MBB5225173.1 ATP-dependent RNA helicase RhlB [Treponema ruminis]QSI01957.1 ATP-dependent helicase [Treponema ruminis]